MPDKYRIVPTTADVGIEAFGTNEKELLENCLQGLYFICFDKMPDVKNEVGIISFQFKTVEELVFEILDEAIFYLYTKGCILKVDKVEKKDGSYKVSLKIILADDILQIEVKAVTKHNFFVKNKEGNWNAFVIFDI